MSDSKSIDAIETEDDAALEAGEAFGDLEETAWADSGHADDDAYWEAASPWDDYAQLSDYAGCYPWLAGMAARPAPALDDVPPHFLDDESDGRE